MIRSIFHLSLPVNDLAETEEFYCNRLGALRGRGSADWIDLIVFGHQVTFHQRPEEVVPVEAQGIQHFGAILPWPTLQKLCSDLEASGYPLQLRPTVFAEKTKAEHAKAVLRDPSGHMIELKAYRNIATVLPGLTPDHLMEDSRRLVAIKAFHTLVWAFFAGCIAAIPLAVYLGNLRAAFILIGIVLVEVLVILLNRGSCPLTGVAARYTADRADNFDIFLPVWLARYNKLIFGGLFVLALAYTLFAWAGFGPSA